MTLSLLVAGSASAVLALLGGLHVYWARGGVWPGADPGELMLKVVGATPSSKMPGAAATWLVAFLLFAAAGCVWLAGSVAAGLVSLPWPSLGGVAVARIPALVVAVVLGLRGTIGFVDRWLRPDTRGTPFERLNVVLYSPLCLVLACGILVGTRSSPF